MAPDRLRPGVALAGMGLAIAGIGLERRWLVWVAIAVLAVAFLMRFLKSPTGRSLGRDDPPAG